jgi:acyl carrier protein
MRGQLEPENKDRATVAMYPGEVFAKQPTESELVDQVIGWIRQNQRGPRMDDSLITADTELVSSGLLDSLALIDLIHFIEQQVGSRIDLMDVDPDEFSVVGGLCRIGLRSKSITSNAAGNLVGD